MNVKSLVKTSFLIIIVLIILIFLLNSLTLYQVKENSETKNNINNLVVMQENMNDLIKILLNTKNKSEILNIKNSFIEYEKRFEATYDIFKKDIKKDFVDYFIKDIHKYPIIEKNLIKISSSEQSIEKLFEDIFSLQYKKINYLRKFKEIYPKENILRKRIEKSIMKSKNIENIKILSNVKYYSKEVLFQHKNQKYLNKWLKEIEKIDTNIYGVVKEYKLVAKTIGSYAIKLNNYEKKEKNLQNQINDIVNTNKKILLQTKNKIDDLSQNFIDRFYYIVLSILILTIFFIFILSFKVSKYVSLSFEEIEKKVQKGLVKIKNLNKEIEETQKEVVFTMGSIGESRSKETGNHVKRVAQYSKILALHYGLSKKEAELIKQASPMHDIGKVAIPDSILNKPGRFNNEEREIMNTHAKLGYDMLKHSSRPLLKAAATISLEHHEKWDGTGYPNKLEGEEIHIYGRITALADVFDALGSDRCYKKAWDDEKIFKLFKEERGKHFDPKLIDIFFDNLDEFLKVREKFKDA